MPRSRRILHEEVFGFGFTNADREIPKGIPYRGISATHILQSPRAGLWLGPQNFRYIELGWSHTQRSVYSEYLRFAKNPRELVYGSNPLMDSTLLFNLTRQTSENLLQLYCELLSPHSVGLLIKLPRARHDDREPAEIWDWLQQRCELYDSCIDKVPVDEYNARGLYRLTNTSTDLDTSSISEEDLEIVEGTTSTFTVSEVLRSLRLNGQYTWIEPNP